MPQDVGDTQPTSHQDDSQPSGARRELSRPLHPPNSPALAEPPLPGSGPPPAPPSPGRGQAQRAGAAAATSTRFLSGGGGRTRTGSARGIGSTGITWGGSPAAGTSAGRAQPGSRHSEAGRRVGSGERSTFPKADDAASPAAHEDKALDSGPLRPRPRDPLRSVTRAARAGSGFHWWPWRPPGSAHCPRPPRPFPGPRGRGARAPRRRRPTGAASRERVVASATAACFPRLWGRNGTEKLPASPKGLPGVVARDWRLWCLF